MKSTKYYSKSAFAGFFSSFASFLSFIYLQYPSPSSSNALRFFNSTTSQSKFIFFIWDKFRTRQEAKYALQTYRERKDTAQRRKYAVTKKWRKIHPMAQQTLIVIFANALLPKEEFYCVLFGNLFFRVYLILTHCFSKQHLRVFWGKKISSFFLFPQMLGKMPICVANVLFSRNDMSIG